MNKSELMTKATRSFYKVGFQLKKYSPEILIVAGVVGTVTSAVMACKATLKVNEVLDESKENIEKIHEALETGVTDAGETYDLQDSKKDLTAVYAQTAVKFVKLYGPAVVLGTLSLGAVVTSNNILRKRYVASVAAYKVLDKGFKDYRGRVVERFGAEVDRELRYNIKAKEIEETIVKEDGTEETVTKTIEVAENPLGSEYSRFFDETCTGHTKNPEYNMMFLKAQERYANERLKTKGHVFLNEVYDMLGMARSRAGAIVGWIYDEKCPNGDNYIDFGITDLTVGTPDAKRRFVNGYERSVLLDFNVDGPIIDLI